MSFRILVFDAPPGTVFFGYYGAEVQIKENLVIAGGQDKSAAIWEAADKDILARDTGEDGKSQHECDDERDAGLDNPAGLIGRRLSHDRYPRKLLPQRRRGVGDVVLAQLRLIHLEDVGELLSVDLDSDRDVIQLGDFLLGMVNGELEGEVELVRCLASNVDSCPRFDHGLCDAVVGVPANTERSVRISFSARRRGWVINLYVPPIRNWPSVLFLSSRCGIRILVPKAMGGSIGDTALGRITRSGFGSGRALASGLAEEGEAPAEGPAGTAAYSNRTQLRGSSRTRRITASLLDNGDRPIEEAAA